jgi:DnaJ-class molecular chaperone
MGTLIVAALVGLAVYVGSLWLYPYESCPSCKGSSGKRMSSTGKAWGDCRHCEGSGKRMRLGRRIWGTNR